jgi:nucleotide-binding universal stress UspA family protein
LNLWICTQALHIPLRALVALDGSPLAEAALVPAAYLVAVLAGPAQGALHLVQVVKLPTMQSERDDTQSDGEAREQAEDRATTYLSTLTAIFHNGFAAVLGLQVTWSVTASEDVADALIRMTERGCGRGTTAVEGCSLIAMTTHGRGSYHHGMMGSITGRVLDGTMLPLLIVPPQSEHRN